MQLPEKYKDATQGPWQILEDDELNGMPFIELIAGSFGPTFRSVCNVNPSLKDNSADFRLTDEDRANARLVADAPMLACRVVELEAALRSMLQCFADDCEDLGTVVVARRALEGNENAPCGAEEAAGSGEAVDHG